MPNEKFILRAGALAGAFAVMCLGAMMLIGLQIGPDLENLSSLSPARVGTLFVTSQGKLRTMMAMDDLFALAYVIAFVALAMYTRRRAPILAWIGLGFALTTGVLDWLENSIMLGLIAYTLPDMTRLSVESLLVLNIVTQMKFLCANGAVALFGIGLWNARWLDRLAAILFWLFALINALALISAPLASGRVVGMLVLLVVGAIVLWRD